MTSPSDAMLAVFRRHPLVRWRRQGLRRALIAAAIALLLAGAPAWAGRNPQNLETRRQRPEASRPIRRNSRSMSQTSFESYCPMLRSPSWDLSRSRSNLPSPAPFKAIWTGYTTSSVGIRRIAARLLRILSSRPRRTCRIARSRQLVLCFQRMTHAAPDRHCRA